MFKWPDVIKYLATNSDRKRAMIYLHTAITLTYFRYYTTVAYGAFRMGEYYAVIRHTASLRLETTGTFFIAFYFISYL